MKQYLLITKIQQLENSKSHHAKSPKITPYINRKS